MRRFPLALPMLVLTPPFAPAALQGVARLSRAAPAARRARLSVPVQGPAVAGGRALRGGACGVPRARRRRGAGAGRNDERRAGVRLGWHLVGDRLRDDERRKLERAHRRGTDDRDRADADGHRRVQRADGGGRAALRRQPRGAAGRSRGRRGSATASARSCRAWTSCRRACASSSRSPAPAARAERRTRIRSISSALPSTFRQCSSTSSQTASRSTRFCSSARPSGASGATAATTCACSWATARARWRAWSGRS